MFDRLIVKGSRYEMGYALGQHFRKQLSENSDVFMKRLENPIISDRLEKALKKMEELMPEELDELYGKADGAKLDRKVIALMHCPELYNLDSGCTTAILKKDDRILFSHNEDDYFLGEDKCALVKYEYPDHYVVCFTEYDKLSGSCNGYNSYGLVFSCNYIFHDEERYDNISRYIVSRKLIESRNIEECLETLRSIKPVQPFSFNVMDINENRAINVENDFDDEYITEIDDRYGRSNHFLCKDDPKMSESSKNRAILAKERVSSLDNNDDIENLRQVLCYEDEDKDRCILLDPAKYDNEKVSVTLVNMSFDSLTKIVTYIDYFDKTSISFRMDEFESSL